MLRPSLKSIRSCRCPAFAALIAVAVAAVPGCFFSEQSFPLDEREVRTLPVSMEPRASTRQWARVAHEQFRDLLPSSARDALFVEDFRTGDGSTTDVYVHFGWNRLYLANIFKNFFGLLNTIQCIGSRSHEGRPVAWPGYEVVSVPMEDGLELFGLLGKPTGPDAGGSYIVLTHGLFGSLSGFDFFNTAEALRSRGHHVLAVSKRGHGDTHRRHPEYPNTFGASESRDYISASQWLRDRHGAKRVGLLTYCWAALEALFAAWIDGRPADPRDAGEPTVWNSLPKPGPQTWFDAGIFAVSPSTDFPTLCNALDTRRSQFDEPVLHFIQNATMDRMRELGLSPSHRMWALIDHELGRSRWSRQCGDPDRAKREIARFLNLTADNWNEGRARMEMVRCPLLVLHAANDPLAPAHGVAELFAGVENPNVGVVMIREGGHTGFASLAKAYHYNLLLSFFDPKTGPTTVRSTAGVDGGGR